MYKTIVASLLVASCGKPSGGQKDPEVGGEEKIKNSFFCQAEVKAPAKEGQDEVRGFNLKLTSFVYDKGSVASTLKSTFTFKDKTTFDETISGVFAQDAKLRLETEFFIIKYERDSKAEVYPKFMVGESFDMECK